MRRDSVAGSSNLRARSSLEETVVELAQDQSSSWRRRLRRLTAAPEISPRALARKGVPGASTVRLDPAVAAATMFVNVLALAMPLAVLQIYDRIAPHGAQETLLAISAGLVLVAVFEFALRSMQGYLVTLSAAQFGQTLQNESLRRVLWRASSGQSARPQDVYDQFSAIDRLTEFYGGQGRLAFIELPFAGVFFLMIAIIAGPLALVPCVVFAVFLITILWIGRRMKRLTADRTAQDGKVYDFTTETLTNILSVKCFSLEALLLRRYERLLKAQAEMQRGLVALAGDTQRLSMLFGNVNVVSTLGVGALLVMAGDLTIGGLAACSMLSARAIQPLFRVSRAWTETQRAAIAASEVAELFDAPAPALPQQRVRRDQPARLEAVDFGVDHGDGVVVQEASFSIEPGALTAIVGRDGSGRSSFLRAAAGVIEPSRGAVLIDGIDAAAYREEVRDGVCLDRVGARLFSGTIIENLTLFGHGPSTDDARWASRLLGLEATVDRLSSGYDTQIAVSASDALPAGLLRTISLARAIAHRPRLLLLDEPHAFLDRDAEAHLKQALLELREEITVVFVTGRSDFARRADQVLHFTEGRVIERAPLSFAENERMETAMARPAAPPQTRPGEESAEEAS